MEKLLYLDSHQDLYDVIECMLCSGDPDCFCCGGAGVVEQLHFVIVDV
ncbi:MAG: hypothetical protein ACE3L7_01735 [Candidatus Pristimantibacillus sp.]